MKKSKVGIIGNGFVGEAQAFAFSPISDLRIYDISPEKSSHSLEEVYDCDFIFVSVPTPMFKDGKQDLSYINNVFSKAKEGPIYIIKSTVLPNTTLDLCKKYDNLKNCKNRYVDPIKNYFGWRKKTNIQGERII